jgi:hypothetical protein
LVPEDAKEAMGHGVRASARSPEQSYVSKALMADTGSGGNFSHVLERLAALFSRI